MMIAAAFLFAALVGLSNPAAPGAGEPFLSASHDGVWMSWLEPAASGATALRFARWHDGRWSEPGTIIESRDLVVNFADFPSIVEDASGALFAHWLQQDGDLRYAISRDSGRRWSAPRKLNHSTKNGERGFVTFVPLAHEGVAATWLDDGSVRFTRIDTNGALAPEVSLDDRTCECCTTGMAMTSRGPVIVYRDRSNEEIRDIAIVRQTSSGWTPPRSVHADGWKINGCPVNGPQADAIGDRLAVAWFAAPNDQAHAFVAFSDDAGATFSAPIRVDETKAAGRVDVVMLDRDTAVVTWVEQTKTAAEVRARRVKRNGTIDPSLKIADVATARAAGFPRIARVGRDVYLAWMDQGKGIRVSRYVVR